MDPVVAREAGDGSYEILSRPDVWVAAGELSISKIPVLMLDGVDDEEAADIVRDHYVAGDDDPISEAENFLAIMERNGWWNGRSQEYPRGAVSKVARAVNRSRPYVANALRLLKLPTSIRSSLRRGGLTVGQARPLLTIPSTVDQLSLARRVEAEQMTARDVEKAAKEMMGEGDSSPPATADKPKEKSADLVRLERRVTDLLGAEFSIEEGRAVINFYDDLTILEGVLERLGYRG